MIENKIVALPKTNTTLITVRKKILIIHIRNKSSRRFILCSSLVGHSASEK